MNTVHYTLEKSCWPMSQGPHLESPRAGRLAVASMWGGAVCPTVVVTRPSAGPPPPRAPVLPPRVTRGLSSYWCTTVSSPSGGPCTPIGPVWRVCWPRLSRSLSERACPHWCSCRAVAAGYSFPVAPSALAPPWVWTASPPSVSRVSPLSLERSRSALLCGKARQPCRDSRPSFGSGPRGPRSALCSPGLLTVRRSPPPSCARAFTTQSSAPGLGPGVSVGRVFSLYCGSYFPAALQAW